MSAKKWLILLAVAAVVLVGAGVAVCVGFGVRPGGLSVYQIDQTRSTHAGYLRTTMTSGKEVYVNDYDEAALRLANPEPPQVVGFLGTIGVPGVRAIPGQPVTAYLAGDEGSEMPAYTPFRHANQPPFDWRTATFREMTFSTPGGGTPIKTTDPALLSEVVRLLRVGTPVSRPGFPMAGAPNVSNLNMVSDELPGMFFCPPVYLDASGTFCLAESLMLDTTVSPPQFHAHWIPASPGLMRWLQSR